jgi:hypothetical protein
VLPTYSFDKAILLLQKYKYAFTFSIKITFLEKEIENLKEINGFLREKTK